MQYELLECLRCPITRTKLRFTLLKEFEKKYHGVTVTEVCDGILFSETGFVFPVIDGIPRMLIEAFYDYSSFLQTHLSDYNSIKSSLEYSYKSLINYCIRKNRKTKASFAFEWSFLKADKRDKIWHEDISNLTQVFVSETGETANSFANKTILDVGCGHGVMTSTIGDMAKLAIGVELSKAVENAYLNNQCEKALYIQGDLQFLPFEAASFDLLYSSGVIHHTNNTELSFLLIEQLVKPSGKICLWLYHPQQNKVHNTLLSFRSLTKRLSLRLNYFMLSVFMLPFSYAIKKIKRKQKLNYREEMIDLLDQFTPEFRFEIPQDLAKVWLMRNYYINTKITTENQFGFSIVGEKRTSV